MSSSHFRGSDSPAQTDREKVLIFTMKAHFIAGSPPRTPPVPRGGTGRTVIGRRRLQVLRHYRTVGVARAAGASQWSSPRTCLKSNALMTKSRRFPGLDWYCTLTFFFMIFIVLEQTPDHIRFAENRISLYLPRAKIPGNGRTTS
jgi:hypothetical protein